MTAIDRRVPIFLFLKNVDRFDVECKLIVLKPGKDVVTDHFAAIPVASVSPALAFAEETEVSAACQNRNEQAQAVGKPSGESSDMGGCTGYLPRTAKRVFFVLDYQRLEH